jgi:hypothetical protein
MIKWLKAAGCALALLVCTALPAEARHHHHWQHYRHARRIALARHENSANPTPGIPRRVHRGRNYTPGIPRGPIGNRGGIPINDGYGRGIGMGHGGGHGHGRRP